MKRQKVSVIAIEHKSRPFWHRIVFCGVAAVAVFMLATLTSVKAAEPQPKLRHLETLPAQRISWQDVPTGHAGPVIIDHVYQQPANSDWPATEHPIKKNLKEWLCVLTKISGPFTSKSEQLRLLHDADGNWLLFTESKQRGLAAKVSCMHWTLFKSFTEEGLVYKQFAVHSQDSKPAQCFQHTEALLSDPDDDVICQLNGIGGNYASRQEHGGIRMASNDLYVHQCSGGQVSAYASCMVTGNTHARKSFQLDTASDPLQKHLIAESQGFCALTSIRGSMAQEASIELVRQDNWWQLIVNPAKKGQDKLAIDVDCWAWQGGFPP